MKLYDTLKQFKNIQPDAEFSQRSRTEILLTPQKPQSALRGVFVFLHVLETGVAVVLAGFFILILTGSFSPTRSISPIQYSVIDPQGLHAEAQAIDMQIQLADVEYPQTATTTTAMTNSAVTSTAALTKVFAAALGTQSTSSASTPAATTQSTSTASTTPTTLSVDQALQQLSH